MKKFSMLFLLLVAALSAVPGVIGTQAARHYQDMVDRFRANGVEVVSHSYHQGWFSSEAETQFALVTPKVGGASKGGSGIQRFTLLSQVTHGPLTESGGGLAEIDSRLQLDGEPLFPADYPALIHTFVAFDGSGKTRVDLPPADVAAAGKRPQIRFQGAAGELKFDAAFSQVDLQLSSPGMVLLKEGVKQLDLGDLRIDSHTHQGASGLMLGSACLRWGASMCWIVKVVIGSGWRAWASRRRAVLTALTLPWPPTIALNWLLSMNSAMVREICALL